MKFAAWMLFARPLCGAYNGNEDERCVLERGHGLPHVGRNGRTWGQR